jgi:DNA-binding MltR family transcriptional regulator
MKFDWESLRPFWNTLSAESDRACAILAGSFLDAVLESGLNRYFVQDYKKELIGPFGPLGTFSSKIELCYAIGMIPRCARDEFNLIRKIRNEFAHSVSHELKFSASPIRDQIFSLTYAQMFRDLHSMQDTDEARKVVSAFENPRRRFEFSVALLAGTTRSDIERKRRRKSPYSVVELSRELMKKK